MQKIKLFSILILLFSTSLKSQITKGNWLVGGTASLSSHKVVYDGTIIGTNKTVSYNINPKIGFFPIDKLALGLSAGYYHSKQTTSTSSISSINESYGFGPFIRYYYLKQEKVTNIFSEFGYNYSYVVNDKSNINNFYFSSGLALFFNSSVALEIGVKYLTFNDAKNGATTDDLRFEIGFQIHLEREK